MSDEVPAIGTRRYNFLALYTDPESHNAQCHKQTDGQTPG